MMVPTWPLAAGPLLHSLPCPGVAAACALQRECSLGSLRKGERGWGVIGGQRRMQGPFRRTQQQQAGRAQHNTFSGHRPRPRRESSCVHPFTSNSSSKGAEKSPPRKATRWPSRPQRGRTKGRSICPFNNSASSERQSKQVAQC